jgi:hypothetical protein
MLTFSHPGSRIPGSKKHPIRIHNTAWKALFLRKSLIMLENLEKMMILYRMDRIEITVHCKLGIRIRIQSRRLHRAPCPKSLFSGTLFDMVDKDRFFGIRIRTKGSGKLTIRQILLVLEAEQDSINPNLVRI